MGMSQAAGAPADPGPVARIKKARKSPSHRIAIVEDDPDLRASTSRRDGTGLGLAISRDIAGACFSGTLELHGRSRFELRCPQDAASRMTSEHSLQLPDSDGRDWLEPSAAGASRS
jgi:hypothetical protein